MPHVRIRLPVLNNQTQARICEPESSKEEGTPKYTRVNAGIDPKSTFLTEGPFSPMEPTLRERVGGAPIRAGLKISFPSHWGEEPFYFDPLNDLFKDTSLRAVSSGALWRMNRSFQGNFVGRQKYQSQ